MPLQKLQYRPGVNREGTNYSNEGGFYQCDKIRFRSGYPEKLGGWQSISNPLTYTYYGVARSMWNWVALDGSNLNGVGTNQKLYVENGGAYFDITPWAGTAVSLGANPFAMVNGSKSILVTASGHGAGPGTWVTFAGATAAGGLTIVGEYEIITTPTLNSYTIISPSAATSTVSGGGSGVTARYQITAGTSVYSGGTGWGAGAWSRGAWGSGAVLSLGAQLRLWTLDNFGQDMLAAPRGGVIYYWTKDTATYSVCVTLKSLAGAYSSGVFVPTQTSQVFVSPLQRFVIAAGSNPYDPDEATNPTVFDPMIVRWSDQENAYDWQPTAFNQSGELRLSNGSKIVTILHGRQENLVFTDTALFVMQYLGPPYVWGFNLIEANLSVMSPNSAVTVNNITYWMGMDKFYTYSGTVATNPCTLRQFVFGNLNQAQAYQVVCGSNEAYNEVWWHYPSYNSQVNDSYVIYNYLEKIWYYGSMNRTAWLDSSLRPYPMAAFSVADSYLGVAISSTSITTISLIDASSYPEAGTIQIESEIITYTGNANNTLTGCTRGAMQTTAATHTQYTAVPYYVPNQIMFHELGVDDQSMPIAVPIESYISSSDFDIGDGDRFAFVWRMLPDVSFNGSVVNDPKLFMQLLPRVNSGSAYNTTTIDTVISADNFDPNAGLRYYTIETYTGQVYTRLRGRQMAFKISSTGLGVNWQLGTPRVDIRPDGRR
jgi:hypothetical protein